MKVKKNKLLIWSSVLLATLFSIAATGSYLLSKYNFRFADGTQFVKNGLSTNPASVQEIRNYSNSSNKDIDVLHYDINIELDTEKEKIICTVQITGIVKKEKLKSIRFNFYDNFNINNVLLNNKIAKYVNEDNHLTIANSIEQDDTFFVKVEYSGTPKNLGFGSFNFDEFNGSSVVYTLNEPIYASTWFPCNDVPLDKVQMDISITNDSSKTSLSNGVLEDITVEGSKKIYHWKTKYPIATYLISILSANYVKFSDKYIYETKDEADLDTMNIDYYVFPEHLENAKDDFDIHLDAIEFFSETFGQYPFIEEKYGVAEFMWSMGAMENQTITGIGKNFISGNDFFTGMLVHELAHQWWGNAVTVSDWEDIWLNEGFATYSEALYWEYKSGFSSLQSTMNSYLINFENTTLINPKNMFGRTTYNKGAWVLHMLRREVGDDIFFEILRMYFNTYKYKNTSTEEFIQLAEQTSQKDLTHFFAQWVYEGKGNLEVEYYFKNISIDNKNVVNIKIEQVQSVYENYHFPLDVDLYYNDGSKSRHTFFIDENDITLSLPVDNLVNRIMLDPDGWLAVKVEEIKE
ncbi:MAG: M1 family metallopeptidase [Melioribacteraceae bacterium]